MIYSFGLIVDDVNIFLMLFDVCKCKAHGSEALEIIFRNFRNSNNNDDCKTFMIQSQFTKN